MLSGRVVGVLVGLAGVLGVGFVVAPRVVAGWGAGGFSGEAEVREAFRGAFVEYWGSGDRGFSPAMDAVVDYWFRYHVVKAVLATILLFVLVVIAVLLWRRYFRDGGFGSAAGGIAITGAALFSLLLVLANVQGAIAPFASLFPMLTDGGGEVAGVLEQIGRLLHSGGSHPPALDTMVSGFARYHAAMAVESVAVAVVSLGLGVLWWARFAMTSEGRARLVFGSFGALTVLLTLGMIVVAVANTGNAAEPEAGLLTLVEGGW
ncbi:hypothetical protein [Nocardia goodfellowii]|uniref:Uncharacterized protein n=1 Tax=Nocardia goodfellowii TaxID=882446 RepID=A0ABS4Q7T4_9NOCA|nr:hypothetical protein [Nocardia goodfellowii]MBP2187756.1 hypothetical protein [Nocardia goodfellowii]